MMNEIRAVGKEILAYCRTCKMDTTKVIAAMADEEKIAKVHCKTCNKTAQYFAPKGITEPGGEPTLSTEKKKSKKVKAAEAETQASNEAEWRRLLDQAENIRPYKMSENFQVGEGIKHPNFGEGVIQRSIFPNKIEVLFEKEIKKLIHVGDDDFRSDWDQIG